MTSHRRLLFELLAKYSRNNYQCFVAELFQNENETQYVVCFRLLNVTIDSPDRYNCRYIDIPTEQAHLAAQLGTLTPPILEKLDNELVRLARSSWN